MPTSFLTSQVFETNLNLSIESTLPDAILLHMINKTVKTQKGGKLLTLGLQLQIAATLNNVLLILERIPDHLLFIGILHKVNLLLRTKETNYQP